MYPTRLGIYYNTGDVKMKMGDFRGAIYDFTKSIAHTKEYHPHHSVIITIAVQARADCKFDIGDFRGAIADYNTYLERYDKMHQGKPPKMTLFNRGLAKLNIGDVNGACLDFSRSGERGYDKAYDYIRDYCN